MFANIYVCKIFLVLVGGITPEACPHIFRYTLNIILLFLTLLIYSVRVCYTLKTKKSPFGLH